MVEINNRKTITFQGDLDSTIVEIVQWENEPTRVSLNFPKGEYEVADDFIIIESDYGTIRLNFETKLQDMKLAFPGAIEKLVIKKERIEEKPVVETATN